jgi:UPF0716 protein FxsA
MPLIVLLLVVIPVVEIYVLIQVGQQIGALSTVALLIAVSVFGSWLIRREGARAWAAFNAAVGGGRIPAREVADGVLVILGGALLITPGFVSDIAGLFCILPPTRALLRRLLLAHVARRAASGRGGWLPPSVVRVRSTRADHVGPAGIIDGELDGGGEPPRT